MYTLQWLLLSFFMIPLVEAVMIVLGSLWATFGYRQAPGKFSELILQITTVGREPELVRQTVQTLRSYNLPMPHRIWVVVEPGHDTSYPETDEVIVVPEDFTCAPIDKARALEYTRRKRQAMGLNRADVKLLFIDDDTLPSRRYANLAFNGDYDICQGITMPNRWYAGVNIKHFFLSHLDNIRTRNCLIYCSCTQGMTQKPLFVHGEGLTMTGLAEDIVTWDRPIVASDDLVFGTNAARIGLSWGYFQARIQLVSPWSFKDNLTQRHRWTWGNFMAIGNREIMPLGAAIFKALKYALGFVSTAASTTGAILLSTGAAKVPPQAHAVFYVSLCCWFGSYALTGWLNSGGHPNKDRFAPRVLPQHATRWQRLRNWLRQRKVTYILFRIAQTIAAIILTPLVAVMPIFVITYSILKGKPKRFETIAKSNPVAQTATP